MPAQQAVESQPPQANQPGAVRHRRIMLRLSLAILLVFGLAIVLAWRFSKPGSENIPADLPEMEKQEIAGVLHHFTIRHAFRALRSGYVREFVRVLRIARKQRVSEFRDNHDGIFRVYTVVDDPKEKDGWYAWSRHEMQKTNDHWVIIRSY